MPFIIVLYTICVVEVWQLNSPLPIEVDWKLQLHRSLMAAVRASLSAFSIQSAIDYNENNNFCKARVYETASYIAPGLEEANLEW